MSTSSQRSAKRTQKVLSKLRVAMAAHLRPVYTWFKREALPPPPLVRDDFLAILQAWDPSASREIRKLTEWYPKLLSFQWSPTDIQLALKLKHDLTNYVVLPDGHWGWKYGAGPDCFYGWIRHSYRQLKAEKLGLSLEDFITLWQGFVGREPRLQLGYIHSRELDARETLAYYLRARRHGLEDREIRYPLFYYLERFESYLKLRKYFDKEFVMKLLDASRKNHHWLKEKYVAEALKRGANREEIVQAVKEGKVHNLALSLRQASKA